MSPNKSNNYYITEPHPTVPQNTYTHAGRGGAGNLFRAPLTTPPTGIPTPFAKPLKASSSGSSTRFYSGRGGAGNIHKSVERPQLSFDEEYAMADARDKASTHGHVGRGGAGNFYDGSDTIPGVAKDRKYSLRTIASNESRRDSISSTGSTRSGFLARLSSIGRSHS
jgi:hypothetical protein